MLDQEIFDGECKHTGAFDSAAGPLEEDSGSPVSSPGPDPVQGHSRRVHLAASQLRKVRHVTARLIEQRLYVKSCKLLDQILLFCQQIPLLTLSSANTLAYITFGASYLM